MVKKKKPSFDDINKKLADKDKLDPSDFKQKKKLECIQIIAERFMFEHKINILDHIKSFKKVGYTYEQGFYYKPLDNRAWVKALKDSKKFVPDRKNNLAGCAASFVTDGTGYRELGKNKSLHCAVNDDKCNIHLDNTGFRLKIPNFGYIYSLDGIQHVFYDLLWDDKVVKNVYSLNYTAGAIADRVQPNFLNSKNKYSEYGVEAVVIDRKNIKLSVNYSRKFNIGKSIKKGRKFYKEFVHPKEHKVMVTLEGKFDLINLIK